MDKGYEEVLTHLRQIDEYEFEQFVAGLWEQYGWKTDVTSSSNDYGIDFVAEKSKPFNQRHLVQVKCWGSENKVGGPEIQQYSSLRHRQNNVDVVVVVTTSSFSRQATEEAKDLNVKLVNGTDLYNLIVESEAEDLVRKYSDMARTSHAASTDKEFMQAAEGDTVEFEVVGLGRAQGEVIYVDDSPSYKDLEVKSEGNLWTLQGTSNGDNISAVAYEGLERHPNYEQGQGRVTSFITKQ